MFLLPSMIIAVSVGMGGFMWHPVIGPPHEAATLATSAELPATPPVAESVSTEPGVLSEQEQCGTDTGAAGAEFTTAATCGRCPPEWPRCNRDRDCDSVCGGKGTGVCEQINSCFKCCTCGGTS